MEKLPVDILIEGLEEWNRKRSTNNAQDYLTLLMIINSDLGNDLSKVYNAKSDIQTQLNLLKEKIIKLSDEENINQVIIVEGIVSRITRLFRNSYKSTLENLAAFKELDNDKLEKIFEKLEKKEYIIGIKLDEKVWNEIVSNIFCNYSFELMYEKEIIKHIKR